MLALAAARLTGHLAALAAGAAEPHHAAAAIQGSDVAHHVVDPDGVAGLDPWRAVPLAEAVAHLAGRERESWVLALPRPGAPGVLRGPAGLNRIALEVGAAVLGTSAGIALVPHRVGPAVQWRSYPAERPSHPPSPYEAERALGETVLAAERVLAGLGLGAVARVRPTAEVDLPPSMPSRSRAAADRASRLLLAAETALGHDDGDLPGAAAGSRAAALRALRAAAGDALSAAVSQPVSAASPAPRSVWR